VWQYAHVWHVAQKHISFRICLFDSSRQVACCLWQIHVVHAILNEDVITIAPTLGSPYWMPLGMPLLFIKHGITVVVTPLKLLKGQFVEMLQDNSISAVSITASNTTNELFEMILLGWLSVILLTVSNNLIDLVL
jgi:hypothetical protein